jgi:probable phosphoglycerate mutase
MSQAGQLWLIRHGETAWSLSGAHTGRTDLPLTAEGERQAAAMGQLLAGRPFSLVLTSPRLRARETCRIAGYGAHAEVDEDLSEWDYGDYEGRSTQQIREQRPGWEIWRDGVVNGETVEQVYARAAKVVARAEQASGDVALFAHGHILRILTACWLALQPVDGRLFALNTATLSVLGYEREQRVITRWNQPAPGEEKAK